MRNGQLNETSAEKIKVLVMTGEFPALSETFILDQIKGLLDRGFDTWVVASRKRNEPNVHKDVELFGLLDRVFYTDERYGVSEYFTATLKFLRRTTWHRWLVFLRHLLSQWSGWKRKGTSARNGVLPTLRLALALESLAPAVIICHFGPRGSRIAHLSSALASEASLITVFHGYDVSQALARGVDYRYLFERGDYFLAVTEFWCSQLVALGCPRDRVRVHRMGIDVDVFSSSGPAASSRSGYSFLSLGRLVEKKGHEHTIKAFATCVRQQPDPPCRLVIVGDGPLREDLRRLVQDLGVESLVEFRGSALRHEVIELMRSADTFVLASVTAANGDMEGLPVSILEAMASELPVIATIHSGIPEAVEDGITGVLVPEGDVHRLTAEMLRMRNRSMGERRKMGRAGRKKVLREFDSTVWNDRMGALIRDLLPE
jgi:colanic acid/amylovoran biosynthesis glycosyltransferase